MVSFSLLMIINGAVLQIAASTPGTDMSNWMGFYQDQLKTKTLADITLPGTHDSGAYWLEPSSDFIEDHTMEWMNTGDDFVWWLTFTDSVMVNWGEAQSIDLYYQLKRGIRYLDIRAAKVGNTWKLHHGKTGHDISTALDQISRFLNENTKEIVVIEFGVAGEWTDQLEDSMVSLLDSSSLSSHIYDDTIRGKAHPFKRLIPDIVTDNKRAIVVLPNSLNQRFLHIKPVNSYANTPHIDQMINYNKKKANEYKDMFPYDANLVKLSWTLTPDEGSIAKGIGFLGIATHTSLHDLSKDANKKLQNFADDNWYDTTSDMYEKMPNIILADYFQESPLVDICVKRSISQPVKRKIFCGRSPNLEIHFADSCSECKSLFGICYSNDCGTSANNQCVSRKEYTTECGVHNSIPCIAKNCDSCSNKCGGDCFLDKQSKKCYEIPDRKDLKLNCRGPRDTCRVLPGLLQRWELYQCNLKNNCPIEEVDDRITCNAYNCPGTMIKSSNSRKCIEITKGYDRNSCLEMCCTPANAGPDRGPRGRR
eukprot:Pgem_evm1s12054